MMKKPFQEIDEIFIQNKEIMKFTTPKIYMSINS
jgi:hypothetical protein